MARAEKVACANPYARCTAVLDSLEDALGGCTPKGRCTIGGTRKVIVAEGGRTSYDVWLDVRTGEGRFRRRKD